MNTLVEHLTEVCKRNRVSTDSTNVLIFLEELNDEQIIELINTKKTVDMTLKYGILEVNEKEIPPGLTIAVRDYDIQPEDGMALDSDDMGPYITHKFKRKQ